MSKKEIKEFNKKLIEEIADDSLLRINSILDSHCIQCHGEGGNVKGKVNLKELQSANLLSSKPELLESLIGVIKDREMPPEEELLPTSSSNNTLKFHYKIIF